MFVVVSEHYKNGVVDVAVTSEVTQEIMGMIKSNEKLKILHDHTLIVEVFKDFETAMKHAEKMFDRRWNDVEYVRKEARK